jgi:hypothetical protein
MMFGCSELLEGLETGSKLSSLLYHRFHFSYSRVGGQSSFYSGRCVLELICHHFMGRVSYGMNSLRTIYLIWTERTIESLTL